MDRPLTNSRQYQCGATSALDLFSSSLHRRFLEIYNVPIALTLIPKLFSLSLLINSSLATSLITNHKSQWRQQQQSKRKKISASLQTLNTTSTSPNAHQQAMTSLLVLEKCLFTCAHQVSAAQISTSSDMAAWVLQWSYVRSTFSGMNPLVS